MTDVKTLTEPQAIFDYVANHLFTQGKPAREEGGGMCRYKADDGSRCAVGLR